MQKRRVMLLTAVLVMAATVGCGSGRIFNEKIVISSYKELEIGSDSDDIEAEVWKTLLENCVVEEYPQEELDALREELETQYGYAAYYKGMTASELIEEKHGMTVVELAKEQLRKEYAIDLIAEKEGLTLSQEEYEQRLAEKAEESGIAEPKEYESMFGQGELEQMFLEERVFDFLMESRKK
ncbi:MAG: hypothetical protein IJZ53_05560 [Tyzzerella sp.]|nr:hypothetical protein [Tyzzerella sp.]